MTIWMELTKDEAHLPKYMADSKKELARRCGISQNVISTYLRRQKRGETWERFIKVEIDDIAG